MLCLGVARVNDQEDSLLTSVCLSREKGGASWAPTNSLISIPAEMDKSIGSLCG